MREPPSAPPPGAAKNWLIQAVDPQPDNPALPPLNNTVIVPEQVMLAERPLQGHEVPPLPRKGQLTHAQVPLRSRFRLTRRIRAPGKC
jgi:hypothetical protein